mmetsp:Transcript_83940/g.250463  ORF Transcript_83940/g.250463 Transcript_83940/m.250463 type:complete len:222 (-) Transcript_83940:221-886(-)
MSSAASGCKKNFTAMRINSSLLEVSTQAQCVLGPCQARSVSETWAMVVRLWEPKRNDLSERLFSCRLSRSVYSISWRSGDAETWPCWQTRPRISRCHRDAKTILGTFPSTSAAASRKCSHTRSNAESNCSSFSESCSSLARRWRRASFRNMPSSSAHVSYMASMCCGLVSKLVELWKRREALSAGWSVQERSRLSQPMPTVPTSLVQKSNSSSTAVVDDHL